MSEVVDNREEASAGETPATVGQVLRAAREAAQLTVADVAQTLKFSPRQIEALEADDYAALPGNTIVRGFVRSYGKFLKLDVERLLQQIDASMPRVQTEVRPPENMGVASEEQGLRQMNPFVAAAIVLALAALLLALWHFFAPWTKPATANGREAVATAPAAPQAVAAPAESVPPVSAAADTPQPAAGADATAGIGPTPPATAPLHFVFEGRSWLEVSDATRQVIATGENPAGSQLTVNGKPPFDIVIGNAPKVKLTYGERVVDLAPYTRADVARFRLE